MQKALDAAVDDQLPSPARLSRIESKVLAEIASARETDDREPRRLDRESASRPSGWRPPTKARARFASMKVGLAALVGMGAAWSSVTGYRAYQATFGSAETEPATVTTTHAKAEDAHSNRAVASDETPAALPSSATALPSLDSRLDDALPTTGETPLPIARSTPHVAAPPPSKLSGDRPLSPFPSKLAVGPNPRAPSALGEEPGGEGAPVASPPAQVPSSAREQRELEEDLLERATRALRTDPQAALAVAETHRRSFAAGRLAQEREVIAIQALAKLKRFDAARARAAQFLAEHPESPYVKDVIAHAASAPSR
jgi:hypothetical protein